MDRLARGMAAVSADLRDESHPHHPQHLVDPMGTKTCTPWTSAPHRCISLASLHLPTLMRCAGYLAQTDVWLHSICCEAHLMPKGSTQEAGDLLPQVLIRVVL